MPEVVLKLLPVFLFLKEIMCCNKSFKTIFTTKTYSCNIKYF